MKNIFVKTVYLTLFSFLVIACNKDDNPIDEKEPKIIPENIIDDNPELGFSTFQYTNLYKILGTEAGKISFDDDGEIENVADSEFTQKLKAEGINVSFNKEEFEYSYFAKNSNAPYEYYLVKYAEDQAIDYKTIPAKRYPAVSKFVIIPVDENRNPVKIEIADTKRVFNYFFVKANEASHENPTEFLLYNRMLGAKGYFEYFNEDNSEENLKKFIQELNNPLKPNIHTRIVWYHNPDSRLFANEEQNQASAEKNTPIQRIIYDFEQKTMQIEIEINLPADKHKADWRE